MLTKMTTKTPPPQQAKQLSKHNSSPKLNSKQTVSPKYNRCWDWFLTGGNTHYARNRSTFTSYRRSPLKVSGKKKVLGIGTVELAVQQSPNDPSRSTKLVLTDVLHIPDARCNGLSMAKYRDENPGVEVREVEGEMVQVLSGEEEGCWFAEEALGGGCSKVVLDGRPEGEKLLGNGDAVLVEGVIVSWEEREKMMKRAGARGF